MRESFCDLNFTFRKLKTCKVYTSTKIQVIVYKLYDLGEVHTATQVVINSKLSED
jgi:hypothetical protein